MKNMPHSSSSLVIRVLHWVEWLGLVLVAGATLVAIGQEMVLMVNRREVMLHDILLFFIYLEILTMAILVLALVVLAIRYGHIHLPYDEG